MAEIAAEAKLNNRDPFKTPDPMLVVQEDMEERQERIETVKAELIAEKDDAILNLTIQKQKLKDIINEMEKQTADHVDEITTLKKEVERWQGVECDHQELERLRDDHAFL